MRSKAKNRTSTPDQAENNAKEPDRKSALIGTVLLVLVILPFSTESLLAFLESSQLQPVIVISLIAGSALGIGTCAHWLTSKALSLLEPSLP